MRGYNLTDKPPRVSDYETEKLVEDVVFLIRTHLRTVTSSPSRACRVLRLRFLHSSEPCVLERERCVLVAHDWGGVVAWHLARRHPELLERLVILNSPAPRSFQSHIFSPIQFFKAWCTFLPLYVFVTCLSVILFTFDM